LQILTLQENSEAKRRADSRVGKNATLLAKNYQGLANIGQERFKISQMDQNYEMSYGNWHEFAERNSFDTEF